MGPFGGEARGKKAVGLGYRLAVVVRVVRVVHDYSRVLAGSESVTCCEDGPHLYIHTYLEYLRTSAGAAGEAGYHVQEAGRSAASDGSSSGS